MLCNLTRETQARKRLAGVSPRHCTGVRLRVSRSRGKAHALVEQLLLLGERDPVTAFVRAVNSAGRCYAPSMTARPPLAMLGTQRDPLPLFAGRCGELAALNARLARLCETGDLSSGVSLVAGVAGVGETHWRGSSPRMPWRERIPAAIVREAIVHGVVATDNEGALSFDVPSSHGHMMQRLASRHGGHRTWTHP